MSRSRTARRAAGLLATVLALGCAAAPAAWADGDPASDVLAGQDVYYPYQPKVSPLVRQQLEALLERVRADGLAVKVALIASPADLGTQTKRFGRPRDYAELLGVELEVAAVHDYVLVAMPAGLGTYRYDEAGLPALRRAIAPIRASAVADADALARTAGRGLVAMATATGHRPPQALSAPFALPRPGAAGGARHPVLVALLVLAWLASIAGAFALRVRAGATGQGGSDSARAARPAARLPA